MTNRIAEQMSLARPMAIPVRKTSKQRRIEILTAALATISAQTKGFDEYSQMGCLHDIANKALFNSHGATK